MPVNKKTRLQVICCETGAQNKEYDLACELVHKNGPTHSHTLDIHNGNFLG